MNPTQNSQDEIRTLIVDILDEAERAIPSVQIDRLPASDRLGGEPEWHSFEMTLWELGEELRQHFLRKPTLRKDSELQRRILAIAVDRKAQRGRQSFVMLLGFKACAPLAAQIATEIDDPCVDGQVISTLYLMKARGFSAKVLPFRNHERSWIRKEAERYLTWDSDAKRDTGS